MWGQDKPLWQLLRRTRRRTRKFLGDWWRNSVAPRLGWLLSRVGVGWLWGAGPSVSPVTGSNSNRCGAVR